MAQAHGLGHRIGAGEDQRQHATLGFQLVHHAEPAGQRLFLPAALRSEPPDVRLERRDVGLEPLDPGVQRGDLAPLRRQALLRFSSRPGVRPRGCAATALARSRGAGAASAGGCAPCRRFPAPSFLGWAQAAEPSTSRTSSATRPWRLMRRRVPSPARPRAPSPAPPQQEQHLGSGQEHRAAEPERQREERSIRGARSA